MSRRVLVIAPHPDDEALGCGGTILLHVGDGDGVDVVYLTSGEQGVAGSDPSEVGPRREEEARRAAAILGVGDLSFWREPDGALEATDALVARLADALAAYDVAYVTHADEQHPDHRAAAAAAVAAADAADVPLWMYEVWTPLQRLDLITDITGVVEHKRRAIEAHASQCAILGFADAFIGLSRYRGELHSWPGGPFAEAFRSV